ncbi:MAG: class II aldolase/adducin family protein [Spirochaetia bacterium]|nr:class II aldolase/adducin family protein [Spirochaetia bacterium]
MDKSNVKEAFKQMIVDGGNQMVAEHLTVGTWGNLSIRDPETNLIYLKPSAMKYSEITTDDILVYNSDFERVDGHRKPTIEYQFHIAIMNARPDVNCVIHTHPVYSAVLGTLDMDLPGICEDFVQLVGDKISNCTYALPGTLDLADNVVAGLGQKNAVMIPNHGTVCVGADWDMVMKVCFVVEKSAQVYVLAKTIGKPILITDEDVAAMQDFAKNHYGQGK